MMANSERDLIAADLLAVEDLLEALPTSDRLGRRSLESRRSQLREKLEAPDNDGSGRASVSLFFAGQPVKRNLGIDSEFAGQCIYEYQKIVGEVFAAYAKESSTSKHEKLFVTGTVRGSFGFQLDEILGEHVATSGATPLKSAVDRTTELMQGLTDDNENMMDLLRPTSLLVLESTRNFFRFLFDRGATLRLVSGTVNHTFDEAAIYRGIVRSEAWLRYRLNFQENKDG